MRRWLASGAVVVALAVGAQPASAVGLRGSTSPLPGSTFQGADGDQDDASRFVDWQGLQARGRVVASPDPNDADSAFKGGTKEDEPGTWDLTTESGGVNPPKDNVRDAWTARDGAHGQSFLYLGFTREKATGTTYLTFELNQDPRLWDNGRARVPCRRTGDLLLSYQAEGTAAAFVLQRWTTTAADPSTACATRGKLSTATRLASGVVQGALNASPITSRLPGALSGKIDTGRFGEAAVNLGRALGAAFGDGCFAFASVWMHSRSSTSEQSQLQDYVAPRSLRLLRCAASGTKFFDRNANAIRDGGERGIPRFQIWADYDDDGVLDPREPFSLTGNAGRYVIKGIRPPDGTYTLRETTVGGVRPTVADWRCSYPNASTPGGFSGRPGRFGCGWGPITVRRTPYASGRDFGNWYPGRLVVRKQLRPADDPGRFDLLVNGTVVVPAAGDGARVGLELPPGRYDVAEAPTAGTDGSAYASSVRCKTGVRPAVTRVGTVSQDVALAAGGLVTCTFRNIRPAAPAIAIDKTGPATALAGAALRYRFAVTNPGDVPFPASGVTVADEHCDDPPALVRKDGPEGSDTSPGTLDPGDTWTYACTRTTRDPGADCAAAIVTNTGTVTGTTAGVTAGDDSTIETLLRCPDRPSPPPVVPLPPEPGSPGSLVGPVAPPGGVPPVAGLPARAALVALPACVRRGSTVVIRGRRIARVALSVNRRPLAGVSLEPLDTGVRVRVRRRFPPGRYRVSARVRFEQGSGTAPVTLRRVARVCGRPAPRFTG